MNKAQAIHNFWSSFSLPAYDENTVLELSNEDKPQMPYITYNFSSDALGYDVYMSASLWYRSTSWKDITNKSDEISNKITRGGIMIPYNSGLLWIRRGSPFSQRMTEPSDDTVRRIIINITAEFISAD